MENYFIHSQHLLVACSILGKTETPWVFLASTLVCQSLLYFFRSWSRQPYFFFVVSWMNNSLQFQKKQFHSRFLDYLEIYSSPFPPFSPRLRRSCCVVDVAIQTGLPTITCLPHCDGLWFSVMVSIYCKRELLWWELYFSTCISINKCSTHLGTMLV